MIKKNAITVWTALHRSAVFQNYSPSSICQPYFIFSHNTLFQTDVARMNGVNVNRCVVTGGVEAELGRGLLFFKCQPFVETKQGCWVYKNAKKTLSS